MHRQWAEAAQDLLEVGELEQVAAYSAVDYWLPANRLRRNFRQSRRMLP